MSLAKKLVRQELLTFKPYSTARSEGGFDDLIWLDANENPHAPFPADGSTTNYNRYAEPQPKALLKRMANFYEVQPENIVISRGADEAIDLVVRTFCKAGDKVVISTPTFGVYALASALQQADVVDVPLDEAFHLNVQGIKKACQQDGVKMLFICSPNNPTGNLMREADVLNLCDTLKETCMVVIDEAYIEFTDQPSMAARLAEYENLIVLRTLSKSFGLAGERTGCAIASAEVVNMIRCVMQAYPVPVSTMNAAMQALSPAGILWAKEKIKEMKFERDRLANALAAHDDVVSVYPSDTNFILIKTVNSKAFIEKCMKAGFLPRDRDVDVANTVRLSVSTPSKNTVLLKSLGLDVEEDKPQRTATVNRATKETNITVMLNLDKSGEVNIDTGIGFFDHMLEQIAKHGGFNLTLLCNGDLEIDDHHTIEDCALAFGQALKQALGNKRGIERYGFVLPMDETQVQVALDLGGRPYSLYEADFKAEKVGEMATEMVPHFFRSVAETLGANIHIKAEGENAHHIVEGSFKGFARALRMAIRQSGTELPSTKGVL